MNHQFTFADGKFNGKRRKTRKDLFLARMDVLLPWEMMQEAIESVYHKAGNVRYPYRVMVISGVWEGVREMAYPAD